MNWETRSLESLIEKPISGEWGDGEGEISVLRTTNFTNDGSLDLAEVVKRNISPAKIKQKQLLPGDTIIEKSGGSPSQPVGRVVYFDQKDSVFLCNNFTSVIRPKQEIDSRYLFWFLYSNHLLKNTLKYQNKTTGIINLQLERYIKELEIPLPPLPTQQRIAAILDAADSLQRKDRALLQKYDALAQAIFIDMFGDPVKNEKGVPLDEIIKINPTKSELKIPDDLEVSFISMNKVGEEGSFDNSETRSFSDVKSGFTYFYENDVLFAKITPCMENGKGAIAKDLKNNIGFGSTEFHVLRPNKKLNSNFLYNLSVLPSFRAFAELSMTGSAGQKRVPTDFFHKVKIVIPSENDLIKFDEVINSLNSQRKFAISNGNYSASLFNSLIQKAFKGELTN
jgi:type I restriction enzyme S subunit